MAGPYDLSTPTTKMLAIGRWTEKGQDRAARFPVMKEEVPATVKLYLTGVIEQWYIKPDISGELLEQLPLGIAGMMAFDFVPLGPITPLRFLLS
jgi:hypothetical protein